MVQDEAATRLRLPKAERRELWQAALAEAASYLEGVGELPVAPRVSVEELRERLAR